MMPALVAIGRELAPLARSNSHIICWCSEKLRAQRLSTAQDASERPASSPFNTPFRWYSRLGSDH